MNQDKYNLWNGDSFEFTFKKICMIIGIDIPACFENKADNLLEEIGYNDMTKKALDGEIFSLCFDVWPQRSDYNKLRGFIKNGGILISSKDYYDNDGEKLNTVYIDNAYTAWLEIGKYIKNVFKMPTIGITGSVGKTTTTMFAELVFSEKFNPFVSGPGGKNYNIPVTITKAMTRRYSPEYNIHIQECGGGRSELVTDAAKLLDVDVFAITGVNLHHHTDAYNGSQDLINDKTSFDRFSSESAVGIINLDDAVLCQHQFKKKTITIGIKNKNADYVAENIEQTGKYLSFDIVHQNERVPIKIEIIGAHNVYNALLVYVMAKLYKMTDAEIQSGFLKYRGGTIRQSVREVAGRILYIDCFNVCADSIISCCETMRDINIGSGSKIAIINGENALGDKHYEINYKTGVDISKYDHIDRFVFTGVSLGATEKELNYYGDGKALCDGYASVIRGKKISYIDNLVELSKLLREETKPGDLILFKGIFRFPLFAAIDMAFGTSYLMYNPNFKGTTVVDKNYAASSYKELDDAVNIFRVRTNGLNPRIPNKIAGCNVYRIGKGIFSGKLIETVDLGRKTITVGAECFSNCKKLKKVTCRRNVKMIEEKAFYGCDSLEIIDLEGIEHIQKHAFANCINLKTVFLPSSLLTIEDDAFENCNLITFIVERGSYAQKWVEQEDYAYKLIEPDFIKSRC